MIENYHSYTAHHTHFHKYGRWNPTLKTTFNLPAVPSSFVRNDYNIEKTHVIRLCETIDSVVEDEMRHLRGASYLSSGNALDSAKDELSSNFLESLSEIREIHRLLPDTKPLSKMLNATKKAGLFSGTLRFADVLTNSYLLYKFGYQPLVGDLENVGRLLDSKADEILLRSSNGITLYGKHVFVFPSWSPLAGLTLTTRTKLRCKIPRASVIAMMLPLEQAGIAPKLSNLWDLVPFSFVVDWFANIGERISFAEGYVSLLTAKSDISVHSYTLESRLDEEGSKFVKNLSFQADEVTYRYYRREFSRFVSAPKMSKYDFLGSGDVPLLSGSSLLWSVTRS
jgi:hypothetical protein